MNLVLKLYKIHEKCTKNANSHSSDALHMPMLIMGS